MKPFLHQEKFLRLMERLDSIMAKDGVPIHNRPLNAKIYFSNKYNICYSFNNNRTLLTTEIYTSEDLFSHIEHWFTKNYGERLKTNVFSGEIVIVIRNTPWRVRFPVTWGTRMINIKDCIVNFTDDYSARLKQNEWSEIKNICQKYHPIFLQLGSISKEKFVNEALGDLQVAIETILYSKPNYGSSKWHSLQFIEKLLKSYMSKAEIKFDTSHHELLKYNIQATSDGKFEQISDYLLKKIQCKAAIRYDGSKIKLQAAVEAHHASLDACIHILSQFNKTATVKFKNNILTRFKTRIIHQTKKLLKSMAIYYR